ncbi:argininosuccinate lyase [Acetivibrio sp. MSJd-27]|uniref:argininosuccinate lyase n=1 Tax=Acetivibrio sp. MSJd-27 TaxID=2841523 RepID=UPI001C1237E3|nr:argininosuccinate lyase [Acetivibrio sp. MSJd-27]MBU5450321.1 argininosuccinate lyase [Acetivibrio sp. MSJd-27]
MAKENSKLWGGRFSKEIDQAANDYNSSIRFDKRLYREDITGSIAHASMLGKQNIIPPENAVLIVKELKQILTDIENGKINFSEDAEDIHMNIETILTQRIGAVGKQLHTGRSRNDQVALDFKMYVKKEIQTVMQYVKELLQTIYDISADNIDTIMPGYTHLQKAQPITLAHHLMAYFQMFRRDYSRLQDCYDRMDTCPLGSGALASTTYELDRFFTAKELGFAEATENSIDGVSDRDFAVEFTFCASMIMMHLSRFCEEIILWCSNEFSFVELDDAFSTGSSIMPQKKNPDIAELTRGKTGRVYGSLMTMLTVMKGLPLAYNKDMQEDKEAVFDAADTLNMCLPVFTKMLATAKFRKEIMKEGAKKGFTNATDAADYLVKNGIPFRDAHEIIGKMVAYSIQNNISLEEIPLEKLKEFFGNIKEDFYEAISLETCVNERKVYGGPAKEAMKICLKNAKAFLEN